MALTNFGALLDEELTIWSRTIWKAARNSQFLNRFTGNDMNSMIQRISELTKNEKGARAVITLVADLEGDGVAGDRTLEGNEEPGKAYDQVIRLDQLRHANKHEGRMAEQRTVVRFREQSRDILAYWLADRVDQMAILTMSGISYSSKTNGAARVGSDLPFLDFAADVTAPTTNRHRRWDNATKSLLAGNTASVAAGDLPSWAMLVEAKAYAKENFIRPIRGEEGLEMYNVFMTPTGLAKLKLDSDFLAAWRNAGPRSASNPLFKGYAAPIMVDGLAIYEYRHVYNTKGLTSGNKWGGSGTIDGQRILFCGAQAMGLADIGAPEWVEKGFDYENQQGISLGKIMGMKKPVFRSIFNQSDEDFGLFVLDTSTQ